VAATSERSGERGDERVERTGRKSFFPATANRARVNYHSSGERDAQKRNVRGAAQKDKRDCERTRRVVGEWAGGGWGRVVSGRSR